jgi:signal transduction histidine kinase
MLQVSVRDLGVGISSGDLPKLFHKLSRVGSPRELEVRGAGLGL